MSITLQANLQAVPLGPYTTAEKAAAWGTPPSYDPDPLGTKRTIQPGPDGKNWCRLFFPKGVAGASDQTYHIGSTVVSSGTINVAFDYYVEPGFDLLTDVQKVGMQIMCNQVGNDPGPQCSQFFWIVNNSGGEARFSPIIQVANSQLAQPPHYSAPVVPGATHSLAISARPGLATFTVDGVAWTFTNTGPWQYGENVYLNDYYHYGGGKGPLEDSYALTCNQRYFSAT